MGRRLPPLPAIEAFLFAARSSSFRAAARQLALSPSAFSRRLQTLEAFIGVALFERSAPPTLTEAGRRYYQAIAGRLDEILAATEALRQTPTSQRLMLLTPPSLATNWLMPRFSRFGAENPGLDVDIVIGRDLNVMRQGKADVALAGDIHDFTGFPTEPLMALEGIAVAPRVLASGRRPPRALKDLPGHKLLAVHKPTDFWARWLELAGYAGPSLGDPTRYETWGLMYEAAANGFGLAIAVCGLANNYLRDGRLAPCVEASVDLKASYRIAFADQRTQSRADVRRLTTWLVAEMKQSSDEYQALVNRPGPGHGGPDPDRAEALVY
ncbi:MAG: LysR family transcriptional regulator [Caulobacteraceae bacterium]|nr:LysR family transcriptional regulator [Caulobacteraceae bacterium]